MRVDTSLDPGAPAVIADFQKFVPHRPKPQGFINHTTPHGLAQSTILRLNTTANRVLLNNGTLGVDDQLSDYLIRLDPLLALSLVVAPAVGVP